MSAGNLVNLPYQDINVNNILCNIIATNSTIIDDFAVDNLSLSDLTINNDETQILVLNLFTDEVQKRTIPFNFQENIYYYGQSDDLTITLVTSFQNKLTLIFTPEVSGPFRVDFSTLFGTLNINFRGELRFFTNVITPKQVQNSSSLDLNNFQTFNETLVISLIANQQYTFGIDFRAIDGQTQIKKSRILVQYIG